MDANGIPRSAVLSRPPRVCEDRVAAGKDSPFRIYIERGGEGNARLSYVGIIWQKRAVHPSFLGAIGRFVHKKDKEFLVMKGRCAGKRRSGRFLVICH